MELAESVKASDDGMVYTYKLHPNIKFHNGRQLTADDVLYSFNRIMSMKPASPASRHIRIIKGATEVQDGKAETISGLKKVDDLTFEITLENPVDPKYFLFWVSTAIVPKEEAEREDFSTNPVGCGPFKFGKWVKGSKIELVKNPEYFKAGKPYLDKVIINIMSESASRDLAFKAKDLDATIVGAVHYPEYKKDPVISKNMVEVAEMFTPPCGLQPQLQTLPEQKGASGHQLRHPDGPDYRKGAQGQSLLPPGLAPLFLSRF